MRRRPAASMTSRNALLLCVRQLSMKKTLCGSGYGLVQEIYEKSQYLRDLFKLIRGSLCIPNH